MWSGDPWARAQRATREMENHLAAIASLADERAFAVRELLDGGLTRADVARRLGVTPATITKILKRPVVVAADGTSRVGRCAYTPGDDSRFPAVRS